MIRGIRIDKDSYGTIIGVWFIAAALIWCTAKFIEPLWISIPLSAFFVGMMFFITDYTHPRQGSNP